MRRQPRPAPDVDRSTPALVLKLDANVFHHGGLGVELIRDRKNGEKQD